MLNGYRFRLYPTPTQAKILLQWIGCQRLIYNAKVAEDQYFRQFQQRFVATAGMPIPVDQTYHQFISEETRFLRSVPSQILRNGAVRFYSAYQRFFKQVSKRPTFKNRARRQSVWVSRELFTFEPVLNAATGAVDHYRLFLGTQKFPVGEVRYTAHRSHQIPASIHISLESGQWFVGLSAEDPGVMMVDADPAQAADQMVEHLQAWPQASLASQTLGCYRKIGRPLKTSDGRTFDLLPIQRARVNQARKQQRRWWKRVARRQEGSHNQENARRKIARYQRYERDMQNNFVHQTTHQLVQDPQVTLYVVESVPHSPGRRPKAPRDFHGRWVGTASRKEVTERPVLVSGGSQWYTAMRYKALRSQKLAITISPEPHRSQTRPPGGGVSQDLRSTSAESVCSCCGQPFQDLAKHIAQRGVEQLQAKTLPKSRSRGVRFFRSLGPGRSEGTPGET